MDIDEYIDTLPNEPLLALNELSIKVTTLWQELPARKEHQEYDFFLGSFALAKALLNNTTLEVDMPSITGSPREACEAICTFFKILASVVQDSVIELKITHLDAKYSAKFSNGFVYEFSDGDVENIQSSINDLRDIISSSTLFEDSHRVRLLVRLEKLQSEMHKKMSDLDHFWGLIGDAGVAIGKFGDDAKPFVDQIKRITDIVWRTQSRAEELPSDTPMDVFPSNKKDE